MYKNFLFPFVVFAAKKDVKNTIFLIFLQLTLIGWIAAAIIAFDEENVNKTRKTILSRK